MAEYADPFFSGDIEGRILGIAIRDSYVAEDGNTYVQVMISPDAVIDLSGSQEVDYSRDISDNNYTIDEAWEALNQYRKNTNGR